VWRVTVSGALLRHPVAAKKILTHHGATSQVRIRPAIETDIPQILALIQSLTAEQPHNGLSGMTGGLFREQAFRRTPPAFSCLVAEADESDIVGFASYWVIPGGTLATPVMRVMTMFVARASRRRRVGQALIHALATEAIPLGCRTIAWPVAESAPTAKRFAAHCGAQLDPTGTDYQLSARTIDALALR
jgi:GNAT superfamily N-acetyltransferase